MTGQFVAKLIRRRRQRNPNRRRFLPPAWRGCAFFTGIRLLSGPKMA